MSIQLSGADIIDLAVRTETQGEQFYRQAAEQAESPEAQKLFSFLADEEVRHRETFEKLGSALKPAEIPPSEWQEALEYIAVTVEQEFFQPNAPIRAIPQGATVQDMLRQAIQFEQQTLLFFYTLRDLVRSQDRPLVDQIIREERTHVRRLSSLLKGGEKS